MKPVNISHQLLNTNLKKEITKQIRTNVYYMFINLGGPSEPVITLHCDWSSK